MIDKTFEELGEFRDEDGYIDMDKVLTEDIDTIREVRGQVAREKYWITIKDGSILIKANAPDQLDGEYSELICDELAKQAGLSVAEYDMAKYKGEFGLITKNVCRDGEEMISIHELIGEGPLGKYPDVTDLKFVFEELPEKLAQEGLSEQEVDQCMLDLRKQMLFDLTVIESDRHTENLSFIKSKVDGKVCMRLSPMYDTEQALMLLRASDNEPSEVKKMYSDFVRFSGLVAMQDLRISIMPEPEKVVPENPYGSSILAKLQSLVKVDKRYEYVGDYDEMWKRTFDFLCEDQRAEAYWKQTLSKLDVPKAIQAVESRIGKKLPEHVVGMAMESSYHRREAMLFQIPVTEDIGEETKDTPKIDEAIR